MKKKWTASDMGKESVKNKKLKLGVQGFNEYMKKVSLSRFDKK